jgi:hypothetical protein
MDGLRATNRTTLLLRMTKEDVNQYSLQEGLNDVHKYYDQGNLVTALVNLYETVVPTAKLAKDNLAAVKQQLGNDSETILLGLIKQVCSVGDAGRQKVLADTTVKSLNDAAFHYDASAADPCQALMTGENDYVQAAKVEDREARIQKLIAALKSALAVR